MKVRYANDLLLTDLARRITNKWNEVNAMLTNGDLAGAHKKAQSMDGDVGGFITLLYDIRFPDDPR
jgi:hypothetical protein